MTQYPYPYPPAPGHYPYYNQAPDALAPARRAGILMYILGGLIILGSVCCGGVGALLPTMLQEKPELFQDANLPPEATPHMLQVILIVFAVLIFFVAVAMIILAVFVRRGSKGAIITSILLTGICILLLVANAAYTLLAGQSRQALGACFAIIPIGLFVLLLVWLIQGLKSSGQVASVNTAYQQQYWQYQQQYMQAMAPPMPPQTPPPLPPMPAPPTFDNPPKDPNAPPPQG